MGSISIKIYNLPQNLKYLNLCTNKDTKLNKLPKNLSINYHSYEQKLDKLPKNLTHLSINFSTNNQKLDKLPKNLIYINLNNF